MKKNCFTLLMLLSFFCPTQAYNITTLFFDVESIFHTNAMRASGYVGKIDSMRYLGKVGNLPSQEDLFAKLKNIKAISTQVTYNDNLEMPLILSDWLAQLQASSKIKETIARAFTNRNLSDIEVKVLLAIVSMMLTPQHLADTQKVRSKMEQTLQKLKQNGYKLYLVGNWAHINSMKSEFPEIFQYFNGTYMSGDIHLIKPYPEYYSYVLKAVGVNPTQALWIETESKFKTKAQQYGYHVLGLTGDDHRSLLSGLGQFQIRV